MPTVSVIIPAYNQGHYLGRAIQSVLDQTYPDFEIIVVDDGSTDNTAEVSQGFTDPRLRYVYQENRGLSGARNTGIRNSSGKYQTYLDSDDLFLPDKLKFLTEELERNSDYGFVAGQSIPIDDNGKQIGKLFDVRPPDNGLKFLLHNPLHVGSVMLCRSWQERVGFFDETLHSYEDWDMWIRLVRAGCKMGWIPRPVSLYRFHPGQMTRIGNQMTAATFAVLDKVYSDPELPDSWREMKNEAYSNAYLRAAAQAYHAREYELAQTNLLKAVKLNPALIINKADLLANRMIAWTSLPKSSNPLTFLKSIYNNLPDELVELRQRRAQDLGKAASQMAFDAYRRGDMETTRYAIRYAFRFQPSLIVNRGAISIFIRSHLTTKKQIDQMSEWMVVDG